MIHEEILNQLASSVPATLLFLDANIFGKFHLTSTLYEYIQKFIHLLTPGQLL